MSRGSQALRRRLRLPVLAGTAAGLLALAACGSATSPAARTQNAQQQAGAANPDLDLGTSAGGSPAPDFRLVNQFGQKVSLSAFRGKVVILAFTDSRCTTICPLTTVSMLAARQLLGAAGDQVQLLGVNANPRATAVSDTLGYSRSHAMVNQWDFLTGSLPRLRAVWKAYHIYAQIQAGQIDHTPALYVIDRQGREQKLYLTMMAYASVSQAAEVLAQEASSLLPGHPKLASERSLAHISGLSPASRADLPAVPSGSVTLGQGRPRLVLFFATWLSQNYNLRTELTALNAYVQAARHGRLPELVAVDEAVTEPSAGALRAYLAHLSRPLSYPVALDSTGRLADGYGVQDQPWFVLTSATGKVLWKHGGWLPVSAIEAAARKA